MGSSDHQATDVASRYLELMKQCLTRSLFIADEVREIEGNGWLRPLYDPIRKGLRRRQLVFGHVGGDPDARRDGRDWPTQAETMVGLTRLENVQQCVADVIERGVPGDLIETGVWRGGTSIFMRAVLAALGDRTRRVWVADSFQGLPRPNLNCYPHDSEFEVELPVLAVSLEQVRANFEKYGLLDAQVQFLAGWFRDTLLDAPIEKLAVMRLDGDLYESTMDALVALYPRLSVGGYAIIDDYGALEPCRRAVDDYRLANGITEQIQSVDWTGSFWQKAG